MVLLSILHSYNELDEGLAIMSLGEHWTCSDVFDMSFAYTMRGVVCRINYAHYSIRPEQYDYTLLRNQFQRQ